jgi:hypothetical protein
MEVNKNNVKRQLILSEIVNEFVENFLEIAENCDISDFILNEVLENSIDLSSLTRKV